MVRGIINFAYKCINDTDLTAEPTRMPTLFIFVYLKFLVQTKHGSFFLFRPA